MASKQDRRQRFIDVFPGIRDELIEYLANEKMPEEAQKWYKNVSPASRCQCAIII